MLSLPFAGLEITAGAATLAATATAAQVTAFSAAGGTVIQSGGGSGAADGDPGCRADITNNRVLVNSGGLMDPGGLVYFVDAALGVQASAAVNITLSVAKNGTIMTDIQGLASSTSTAAAYQTVRAYGFIKILPGLTSAGGDNPGTIATFPAPSGLFTGGAGAPSTEVPITLMLATSGAATITFVQGQFLVSRWR